MRTVFKERYERETCVPRGQCGEWPDAEHLAVKFKEHNAPCLLRTLTHSSDLKLPFRVNNTSRTTFHILHSMMHGPLYNRNQILWSGFDIHRVYHGTGWYQSDTELFLTQNNRNQLQPHCKRALKASHYSTSSHTNIRKRMQLTNTWHGVFCFTVWW